MIGVVPFTYGGRRISSNTKHGTDLAQLATFANAIQQEFTIANVPFCEIQDRKNVSSEAPLSDGYGLFQKVIITFKVRGERFGFPIYAPRRDILMPVTRRNYSQMQVTKDAGARFCDMYPAEDVEFETGWLCR